MTAYCQSGYHRDEVPRLQQVVVGGPVVASGYGGVAMAVQESRAHGGVPHRVRLACGHQSIVVLAEERFKW